LFIRVEIQIEVAILIVVTIRELSDGPWAGERLKAFLTRRLDLDIDLKVGAEPADRGRSRECWAVAFTTVANRFLFAFSSGRTVTGCVTLYGYDGPIWRFFFDSFERRWRIDTGRVAATVSI
jgi:hypothetical protein